MFALIALLGFRQSFKVIGTGCALRSSFFLNEGETFENSLCVY